VEKRALHAMRWLRRIWRVLIMSGDIENDGVADASSTTNKQDEISNGSGKMPDE
jgi:hypothetical protein